MVDTVRFKIQILSFSLSLIQLPTRKIIKTHIPKSSTFIMKTVIVTTPSSTVSAASSSATSADADGGDQSQTRDSCYFPGCRKDANCTCEICLASINATLDLIPSSSLSKISNPNPKPSRKTPIQFNSTVLSTPRSKKPKPTWSPPLKSTARVRFREEVRREKRGLGFGGFLIRLILGMGLVLGLELGFDWGVSRVLKPELSGEMVMSVIEKTRVLRELNGKLAFLQKELQSLVSGEVSDCGSDDSVWNIKQGEMLLNSQCIIYKSATEEVSIWGWPLQTSGLLTAEFSSRSLTILSGRVTEWSNGEVSNFTVKANQSWVQQKWSASVVQLDKNTWIIEYKRARFVENSRLISGMLEFLCFWFTREYKRIKQEFWFLPDLSSRYGGIKGESFKVPT